MSLQTLTPTLLRVEYETRLSPQIIALRDQAFGRTPTPAGTRDDFDDASEHVNLLADGELAATVRLSPHPHSPLYDWSWQAPLFAPVHGGVDITRGAIAPKFQGRGLYRLLVAEACRRVVERGDEVVVGVLVQLHLARPFLEMGGSLYGDPRMLCARGSVPKLCQGFRLTFPDGGRRVEQARQAARARAAETGFALSD